MADTQEQTAEATATEAEATATQTTTTIDPAEHARIKAALHSANKEAETRRKQLEAYQKAEQDKADAEKTETQKALEAKATAEKERDTARAEAQAVRIETAVLMDASRAQFGAKTDQRFTNPELAHKLIGVEGLVVTVENGKVSGSLDALKALAKKYPELLVSGTRDGVPPTPLADDGAGDPATNRAAVEEYKQRTLHRRR